jgi:hypothetical protein
MIRGTYRASVSWTGDSRFRVVVIFVPDHGPARVVSDAVFSSRGGARLATIPRVQVFADGTKRFGETSVEEGHISGFVSVLGDRGSADILVGPCERGGFSAAVVLRNADRTPVVLGETQEECLREAMRVASLWVESQPWAVKEGR